MESGEIGGADPSRPRPAPGLPLSRPRRLGPGGGGAVAEPPLRAPLGQAKGERSERPAYAGCWDLIALARHHRRHWPERRCALDDSQRDRVRPARADPGVPNRRAFELRMAPAPGGDAVRGNRLGRLRRRHRRARDPPVQPPGRADGSVDRPFARDLRRGRVLGLPAVAALGAGAAGVRECAMLALGRYGQTHGVELRINWPGRLGGGVR